MKKQYRDSAQSGQALITLLFFMVLAIIITGGATALVLNNSQAASKYEVGTMAYSIAESGIENALLRFLRDPNYTGETISNIGGGAVTITRSGSGPYTFVATSSLNNFSRKVQVVVDYTNNVLTVQSWKEIP